MIEDCFMTWYKEEFPDWDPSCDDCYWGLRSAYYAGWQRHYAIDMALWELMELDQKLEGGTDNDI